MNTTYSTNRTAYRALLVSCAVFACRVAYAQPSQQAVADTWVNPIAPSANFGADESLRSVGDGKLALVRFAIPAGSGPATLKISISSVIAEGPVAVYRVLQNWGESNATWSNRPNLAATPLSTVFVRKADIGRVISLDVSNAVARWVATPSSNFGLAVRAGNSTANVRFRSREGGPAPALAIQGSNRVLVSHSGGNYSDPVRAANNAHAGHTWCVNPTIEQPCIIRVSDGTYVLMETLHVPLGTHITGSGKAETTLLARKGLETAIEAAEYAFPLVSRLSDLSVINHQDAGSATGVLVSGESPGLRLSRIAIRVAGPATNQGLNIKSGGGSESNVVDSDVSAFGGSTAFAINTFSEGNRIKITNSRLTATGATQRTGGSVGGERIEILNSHVYADGGQLTEGVRSTFDNGFCALTNSTVRASGDGQVSALVGFGLGSNQSILVVNSSLVAVGPNAIGFEHESVNNLVTLDGADIQGTRAALRWTEAQDEGHLEIRRSRLGGTVAALEIARATANVRIEQSILRAPDWGRAPVEEFRINLLEITDSVLDGDANLGNATLHCTKTLGRNYAPVNGNCLP